MTIDPGRLLKQSLSRLIAEAKRIAANAMKPLLEQRQTMQRDHADERKRLDEGQKQRWEAETRERAGRLRGGVMGLWDRVTGDYQKTTRQNEVEAHWGLQRDREQRQALVVAQLAERQRLQQQILETRTRHAEQILALHKQAANYRLMRDDNRTQDTRREFNRQSGADAANRPSRQSSRGLDLGR